MSLNPKRRFAFIVPRFGKGSGGAETLVGALAQALQARGDQVEIWTTCGRDHRNWANEYEAGEYLEDNLKILRFPIDKRDLEIWIRHQVIISNGMCIGIENELDWMQNGVNSAALYAHIKLNASKFEAIFFAPYLFGTTFFGSQLVPEKSVLIPCLHDEHYAYLDLTRAMFNSARGALFNAKPEMELAQRLFGHIPGAEVGMGFEDENSDPAPYFSDSAPYVLYLGRKEEGKGAALLLDSFVKVKASLAELKELRLVICGGGDFSDLKRDNLRQRPDIIDLEHVGEEHKKRLLKHALCLVQPSVNESFSIVLMEAWRLGTPAVVNASCEVTRRHVTESGGGLYFSSVDELGAVLEALFVNRDLCRALGSAGKNYVKERYNWPAVLARFDTALEHIFSEKAASETLRT